MRTSTDISSINYDDSDKESLDLSKEHSPFFKEPLDTSSKCSVHRIMCTHLHTWCTNKLDTKTATSLRPARASTVAARNLVNTSIGVAVKNRSCYKKCRIMSFHSKIASD